jgi:DNA-binding response OmpR family regulator
MISGLQSDEDVQAANEEGAAGYVSKPYDVEALLAQIAGLVNAA